MVPTASGKNLRTLKGRKKIYRIQFQFFSRNNFYPASPLMFTNMNSNFFRG